MPRLLDEIRIASPCPMRWSQLEGDARVRFCGQCRKNVYNLSEMDPDEAELLIRRSEGPICGRIYRRRDGTVIAGDCVVGARRLYFRLAASLGAAATLLFGGWGSAMVLRIMNAGELTGALAAQPVPQTWNERRTEQERRLELTRLARFADEEAPPPLQPRR